MTRSGGILRAVSSGTPKNKESISVLPPYDLVEVLWEDATGGTPEWQMVELLKPELPVCASIGYCIRRTKNLMTLLPHFITQGGQDPWGFGEVTIPRKTIVGMKVLRKKKR